MTRLLIKSDSHRDSLVIGQPASTHIDKTHDTLMLMVVIVGVDVDVDGPTVSHMAHSVHSEVVQPVDPDSGPSVSTPQIQHTVYAV
jgi:hypothetical protein